MSKSYWTEAASTITFIYNQTPHSIKNFVTFHELKYKKKSDISSLKIWDSIVYRKNYLVKKLDLRTIMRVLVSYESNQWRILDPRTKKVTWTRNVTIKEGHFYNDKGRGNDIPDQLLLKLDSNETTELTVDSIKTNTLEDTKTIPQQFYNELIETANVYNVNVITDSITYKEVVKSPNGPEWQKAMKREMSELENQKTWTLTKLSFERKTLKGYWIYKTKTNSYDVIQRYKARYVIKEYL